MSFDARVPAATGKVHLSAGPNGNTRIQLVMHHLAPPSKACPGASIYVVWAKVWYEGAVPQNLGELRVDKDLSASLDTVTPLRTFDLFLSCEVMPAVQRPTGPPLMLTPLSRP
jgi:hypothetical protein